MPLKQENCRISCSKSNDTNLLGSQIQRLTGLGRQANWLGQSLVYLNEVLISLFSQYVAKGKLVTALGPLLEQSALLQSHSQPIF